MIFCLAPAFNSEPTELERQRELNSLRLKEVFRKSDEKRKSGMLPIHNAINVLTKAPPALDVQTILNCELASVVKTIPPSPNFTIPGSCDSNAASAARSSPIVENILPTSSVAPSQLNPPVIGNPVVLAPTPQNSTEKTIEPSATCQTAVDEESNGVETSPTKLNLFYTPDEEEKRTEERTREGYEEIEPVDYVPPFNNPIYPNDNDNFQPSDSSVLGKFVYLLLFLFSKAIVPVITDHVRLIYRSSFY